ncbi:MAG: signal recognition particle-docking protein FtsY [Nitrospiria bacterium]
MTNGFWRKTGKGLAKTRRVLTSGLDALFLRKQRIDEDTFDLLMERLIGADLGVKITEGLVGDIRQRAVREKISDTGVLKGLLKTALLSIFEPVSSIPPSQASPSVILFMGVNGVGKTTTIGKLARQWTSKGKRVLLAAADTFRAGAGEQLAIWGKRAQCDVIRFQNGADPSAVAYDAVQAALARKVDALLVDTAGRLQTQHNLMGELKKISRVISKQIPEAPHEKLLVLDATTGQNAISQAEHFQSAIGLTGIVMTKLDGSGRGGVVVPIVERFLVPIRYIGVGEGMDDLIPFDPEAFVSALFEED